MSLASYAIDPNAVPGRLGLLVTVDLISMNCYNSVEAPMTRGLSYVEIWLMGMQIPILVGFLEYGIILAIKKYSLTQKVTPNDKDDANLKFMRMAKKADMFTFLGCAVFILVFTTAFTMNSKKVGFSN